jgi:hypothetical protein
MVNQHNKSLNFGIFNRQYFNTFFVFVLYFLNIYCLPRVPDCEWYKETVLYGVVFLLKEVCSNNTNVINISQFFILIFN